MSSRIVNGRLAIVTTMLCKRKLVKQLPYFCSGFVFMMLIIYLMNSDYMYILKQQSLSSQYLQSYSSHMEHESLRQSSENIHPIQPIASKATSAWIFKTKSTAPPSRSPIIVASTKNTTNRSNFTGPFSINDTNTPLDVRLLYLPNNLSSLCSEEKQLIVIVISSPLEFDQRNAVRQTWATEAANITSIIFHIGSQKSSSTTPTSAVTEKLKNEQDLYGDILVSNVVEDYYNLSLKTYATLLFVSQYCGQAKCVLKSDSDTVANLPAIEKLCSQHQSESPTILGSCEVRSPLRDPYNKWFTPVWVWPKKYPKFCLGSAYMLIGSNTSAQLVNSMNKTAFAHSDNLRKLGEDVVWTGIVAEKARINRTKILGFSPRKNMIYHCFEDGQKSALTVHYIRGIVNMEKHWRLMHDSYKCVTRPAPVANIRRH